MYYQGLLRQVSRGDHGPPIFAKQIKILQIEK